MPIALGLMSGTSGDGVSAAIVSFKEKSFKLLAYKTYPYSKWVREKIAAGWNLKTPQISELNVHLGYLFAESASKILKQAKLSSKKISVAGSHGQTIYHGPRDSFPSTFQIGEAAMIAEKIKIPVVSDFRPRDIAAGGEGAPLVPYFDHYFYGDGKVRAFQNIGGIANVTIVGRELKKPIAFDTGPGNCFMDLAMQKITQGKLSYDPSGSWAKRGTIEKSRVNAMMRYSYFQKKPPKSTGREEFGEAFLKKYLGRDWVKRPYDTLATLTYFTATSIHESLSRFSPRSLKEVIISGGGAKNLTLMNHLKKLFSPVRVYSVEKLGIPVQAKEPIAFAFLALRALRGQINHLPSATGARCACVLGKITYP